MPDIEQNPVPIGTRVRIIKEIRDAPNGLLAREGDVATIHNYWPRGDHPYSVTCYEGQEGFGLLRSDFEPIT